MFSDTWKLYEILTSVSINNVLLERSHAHSFTYCEWQSWIVATETIAMWFAKTKIFTIWPFMKKVCQPLVCAEIASQHSFSDTPWWLIQTFLLGREAENITLSHSPTFWPLSTWGQVHHKILLAAAYSAGHEITTWLVCLGTCQKYVSETAFSFTVVNVVFPFQPLSGSCHPAIEMYLKTKLIITSFMLL